MTRTGRLALALIGFVVLASGCTVEGPPRGPEDTCARACAARAPRCSRHECARGCNLVLDRLAEHEGNAVVACIASDSARGGPCDDRAWAHCAVRVGPHADGGPPAPPPPGDDLDED